MPRTRFLQAGLIALSTLALFAARPARAQLSFTYQSFQPPQTDQTYGSLAYAISANGTVAGAYIDNINGDAHGYTRSSDGTYKTIDYSINYGTGFLPGTYLRGINNAGDLTGYFGDYNNVTTNFIYHNSSYLTPTVVGATYTGYNNVNEAGQVATVYTTADGHTHSAIYDIASGAFTIEPDVTGFTDNYIQTVLPDGTLVSNVGNVDPTTGNGYEHGSITRPNDVPTIFDFPGALDTRLDDVTSTGLYVGNYYDVNDVRYGFVYDSIGQNYYTIDVPDVPGGSFTELKLGNSPNQFVGDYYDANGFDHSLIVTVTPEPGSVALLVGMSVAGAGFLRRRKNRAR